MKRSIASALLCAALLVSLSACGGGSTVSPDVSAQALYAGEWVSYASYSNEKAVPYEDFSWSVIYELRADGTLTYQGADGSSPAAGTWGLKKDGSAVLKSGNLVYALTPLTDKTDVAVLKASGSSGKAALAARSDTAVGRAALKQRETRLTETSDGQRTFYAWCSVSTVNDVTYLDADEVIWVNGSDTDSLALFGIDPDSVTDDYALYDPDEKTFSYAISDSASFIVYLGSARRGANRSGFITVVKNDGKILAKVTADSESVYAVEQVYVP